MLILASHEPLMSAETSGACRRCPRGTTLYHQGDPATTWFEVASGIVRTCRFHADGHRQLTGFFYPGDTFGLDRDWYEETAEAVTDATLRGHARPAGGRDDDDDNARDALVRALGSARSCIFLLGHRTAQQRLAAFLLVIANRTGGGLGGLLPMSRADIADHLGLTIHTVSRTLSTMARKGLIAFDQPSRFRIRDAVRLRDLAGEARAERVSPVVPDMRAGLQFAHE